LPIYDVTSAIGQTPNYNVAGKQAAPVRKQSWIAIYSTRLEVYYY
jgi:hypothetical protein